MNITLGMPYAICERGKRPNNEDAIFPSSSQTIERSQRLFVVCDGVGGAEKGEIASSLACESFQIFFSTFMEEDATDDLIRKAVRYTEVRFDEYISTHPEAEGMATTLTMLYFGNKGVTAAHIGDSRIYQFRNGKPVFRTEDHSLVNFWVKTGKITQEEALHHPQKNIITRAITGSANPTEADIAFLTDIQPNDCFLMCTDGVTDCLSDKVLSSLFTRPYMSEKIKDTLVETCYEKAHDNYSFYLLPVLKVQNSSSYN